VTRTVAFAEAWPRLMRAETASRYVDETSVQAFRRRVGRMWPLPISGKGQRQKWDKEDLDAAVARLKGQSTQIFDAATVLGDMS
jgi:hypothetical protein